MRGDAVHVLFHCVAAGLFRRPLAEEARDALRAAGLQAGFRLSINWHTRLAMRPMTLRQLGVLVDRLRLHCFGALLEITHPFQLFEQRPLRNLLPLQ